MIFKKYWKNKFFDPSMYPLYQERENDTRTYI